LVLTPPCVIARSQELVRSPRAVRFILGALLRTATPPAARTAQQLQALLDDDVFAYLFQVRARACDVRLLACAAA
jgi:hypothetical protein